MHRLTGVLSFSVSTAYISVFTVRERARKSDAVSRTCTEETRWRLACRQVPVYSRSSGPSYLPLFPCHGPSIRPRHAFVLTTTLIAANRGRTMAKARGVPRVVVVVVSLAAVLLRGSVAIAAAIAWAPPPTVTVPPNPPVPSSPSCLFNGKPCPLPDWEPDWALYNSTALMNADPSGFAPVNHWGLVTLDWQSGEVNWLGELVLQSVAAT